MLRRVIQGVKSLRFSSTSFTKFMGFLQFFYLYQVFVTDDVGGLDFSMGTILSVLLSIFTVILFFQLVAIGWSKRRWSRVVASIIFLNLFTTLVAYHFGAQELLNWSVLIDNWTIAFSAESVDVMVSSLHPDALLYGAVFTVIFLGLEFFMRTISKDLGRPKSSRNFKAVLGLYLVCLMFPYDSQDPIINFFRSVGHHYKVQRVFDQSTATAPIQALSQFQQVSVGPSKRPHVIVIAIESLNESALHKQTPSGNYYLPYMRDLREKSVYIPQFYGNSIQTAKGHFGLLFSVVPSLTGKTFVRFPELKLPSMASVFKQNGYDTSIFSAYYKKQFDSTDAFLLARGFDRFDVVEPLLSDAELKNRLRWGVEDAVFYQHFFRYFEDRVAESTKPQFFFLPTIANHFPFNSLKPHQKKLYPNSDGFIEDYANSVHLTDRGVQVFFEELKRRGLERDVLVVITGDHAFPMGLHKNYHLEAGYHEDSFRIPFFMVWDGVLAPQKLDGAFSQMDILPTMIDMLELQFPYSTFQGESIFVKERQNPVFLVQPYGKHVSVVRYPYKYRLFTKTMQEYIYDVEIDPMEAHNIFRQVDDALIQQFRADMQQVFANQKLIKENGFPTGR